MTNVEFVNQAIKTAGLKTLYVKGGFGQVLTESRKKALIKQYDYNKKREALIMGATNDTFAFDCCGLVKGIIWGFVGDPKAVYGGATYASNGMPDAGEKGILNMCTNLSDNMAANNIEVGEFLYMAGHCGIYAGGGKVVESSPAWKNGVQITDLTQRRWKTHGKLPQIQYNQVSPVKKPDIAKPVLRQGSKGAEVNKLQQDLNYAIGAKLIVDGQFGPLTRQALCNFQRQNKIVIDGVYGPVSYGAMRRVLS